MPKAPDPASEKIRKAKEKSRSFKYMSFPEDAGPHQVLLSFKDYVYERNVGFVKSVSVNTSNVIAMPLPTNLEDNFTVNITQPEIGIGGDAVRSAAAATLAGTPGSLGADAARKFSEIGGAGTNLFTFQSGTLSDIKTAAQFLIRGGFDALVPGASRGVDIGLGTTLNPHAAVAFEGMNLKNHSFNWKLAPKSEAESNTLKDIHRFIKTKILPSYNETSISERSIFKYPSVVDIAFVGLDQEYYFFFKRCMVTGFSINYSPTGRQAVLKGGRPAFMEMKLDLVETEIRTAEDYE